MIPLILPPADATPLPVIGTTAERPIEARLPVRMHSFASVVLFLAGGGALQIGARRHVFGGELLLVVPPGRVAYRIEPGRKALFIPLPLTPEAARTFGGAEYRLAAGEAASLAREIVALSGPAALTQRLAALHKQRPHRDLVHTSEHRLAISLLIELAAQDAPARVTAFAEQHGYSADGLSALLRRETGAPFAKWREAILMTRVRRELRHRRRPIGEIARRSGLDAPYFSRRFRRYHGISPSRWSRGPQLGEYLAYEFEEWLPERSVLRA